MGRIYLRAALGRAEAVTQDVEVIAINDITSPCHACPSAGIRLDVRAHRTSCRSPTAWRARAACSLADQYLERCGALGVLEDFFGDLAEFDVGVL
ncbi:hypothetical protein [Streptomyces sp. NBC_01614]|uniref:hypothetical protein n=1 Tax=Streptomyces sp. NBC_01614 TaxID=2975897 RepID=UPI003870526B